MKPKSPHHPRGWLLRRTALGLSAVLVGTLLQVGAGPAAAADGGLPGLPKSEKPVPGSNGIKVKPRSRPKTARTPSRAPQNNWPKPARATIDVPAASGKPRFAQAKGIPVRIARAKDDGTDVAQRATGQAATPDRVETHVLSHSQAERAGVRGMLFTLKPNASQTTAAAAKAGAVAGRVSVSIDYGGFAESFGGDYASRLRLVELPACALTTPNREACRTAKPIAASNDTERQSLTVKSISVRSGTATVLAATTAASGGKGDYKATPLSPSATWSTNLNTGDFAWSYGMDVPAVPGGLKPTVGLSYSSGSIDGRTGGSNNQGSWVGDGFDLSPGFIERRYKPCAEDGAKNADGNKPGDLCWSYDNAFITFNGKGGELVPIGDGEYKLKQDDGTKIKRLTSSNRGNGDKDGEYWRLTTPDGTRYYFGYNRLPGWTDGKDTTDSTWTVPVYGNDSGEPCHADDFAGSWCPQAWRWNVDYVVDPHGNAMAYNYTKEINSYGRNLKPEDDTSYTRGGYLKRIDYGLKSSRMYADKALGQVVFDSAERCLPQDGVTCDPSTIEDKAFYWYDTPWDLNCKADTKCDNGRVSPSFWTRKRLTDITTQVLQSDGSYGKIDSWHLEHRWGKADTDYQLLLDSIQHTGQSATPAIKLPTTTLTYTQLENRLDKTGDGYAPFIKARLSTVADESGGQIDVNYSAPVCDWNALPTPETNTTRCFPQYVGGDSSDDPDKQWFNKYVVTKVTASDRTGGAPDQVTAYSYLGGGAWHFDDDDGLTKEKEKTWSQWRGYGHVRVRTGGEGGDDALKTQKDSYYLRGMDGDRKDTSGGTKSVTIALDTDEGDPITDHESTAGFEYKTVTFDKPDGKVLAKTVSRPWHHETAKKVRDWGTVTANFTGTSSSKNWTSLDGGAGSKWRVTSSATEHDTVAGRVTEVDDFGDNSTSTDNQCTRTTYATNTTDNILNLTQRVETVAKACDAAVDRTKDVISDVRTGYDKQGYGVAPTKGDATATATLKSHDGTKATYLESGATFDDYGRVLTSTDLTADVTVDKDGTPVRTERKDGRTTNTTYTPSTGLPTQKKITTPPAVATDPTTAQTTTEDLDPLRGQTLKQTDTNGNATQFTYDALGRSSKVWLADRTDTQTPNYEFTYSYTEGKPVAVGTKILDNNGGQITSYVLYDGFLRERQTQEPGPDGGRVLTDAFYDERGLAAKNFAAYYTTGQPTTELFKPDDALKVETQTRTTYDGLGRAVQTQQVAGNSGGGTVLSTTKTVYGGDRVTVIPPVGGTATTTLADARGNATELRQHLTRSVDSGFVATTYDYSPRGELERISDADGNVWRYTYDQLGRQKQVSDPDKGTATSEYDDRGQLISTKDARPKVPALYYVYDNLGRKTETREGSATGKLRAKWVYDTISGAQGQLAESTRYVNGEAYTSKVIAYDRLYQATKTAVVIPAAEGKLAGTYQTGTTYKPSGLVASVSYSAAGSLAGGSFNYAYEDQTLRPTSVYGQGMTSSTSYSLTGKPLAYQMGLTNGGKKTQVTNAYEWGTQRLANSRVDREEQPGVDRDATYRYDEAGNVLSMSDVSRTGTDNQCFTYDYAGHLTEAWTQNTTTCATAPTGSSIGGPAPYWQSYTYDKLGNRKTETQHNTAGDSSKDIKRSYDYPGVGKPQAHALSSVTTTDPSGTKSASYAYDETGNTTTRPGQGLFWDTEGDLVKVTEGSKTTEYLYDADGNRLIARTDMETTLYLGHTEVTLPKGADKAKATRYIGLGSGQTAVRNDDGTFAFTIADHQGTGQLAIQASDLSLAQRRSLPFGGARGDSPKIWPGSKGFVGGTDDGKSTGLTHLGAREYDPTTGRFMSVDPLIEPTKPQSLNGYTYSENNPVTTSDPTGLSNSTSSCSGSSCDGESQFKESHASPDFSTGQTWEEKYPWETSHYGYYDNRAVTSNCDAACSAALDWAAEQTPTITGGNLCGVSVSSGCDAQFRERVAHGYKEMTVLDDYYNCTFHHDQTACDVSGAAFSSGGGTWAASIFFGFAHAAENRLAIAGKESAEKLRGSAGAAVGGWGLREASGNWLRGTSANAAKIPGQVARKLQGREFKNWNEFRKEFWRTVGSDPDLSGQFSKRDYYRMQHGAAPKVDPTQEYKGQTSYVLHHVTPIQRGGGVYDLDNLVVVTPRYHQEVLDGSYHMGK
ncbi:RHS repeat-associated core domain-containing protein [Streptomyces sp. NPDC058467]|uniref:RHS repeat-associated core domain-containing protein n=1 Tax=Streptomyces sp. NPDC058467 TaxID=3346513 RepID=UPI00364F6877